MIVIKTPLRISFCGGGSDLPSWSSKHSAACVNAAINKYVYVLVKKRFDDKIYLKYSENEIVDIDNIDQIKHDFIRETLKFMKIDFGLEVINFSDIPTKGCGLGSSSSFLVGLLHALHILKGNPVDLHTLAEQACYIEIEKCKKQIGFQDQFAAAYGGLNFMQFYSTPYKTCVNRINLSDKELHEISQNIFMFYTGLTREASEILSVQDNKAKDDDKQFIELMKKNVNIAEELFTILSMKNKVEVRNFSIGIAMRQNWDLKKQFSSGISNYFIENMVEVARKSGAIGCKITGAGGGGFLVVYATSYDRDTLMKNMLSISDNIRYMPVEIDKYGTRVLLNTEEFTW